MGLSDTTGLCVGVVLTTPTNNPPILPFEVKALTSKVRKLIDKTAIWDQREGPVSLPIFVVRRGEGS